MSTRRKRGGRRRKREEDRENEEGAEEGVIEYKVEQLHGDGDRCGDGGDGGGGYGGGKDTKNSGLWQWQCNGGNGQ